MNVLQNIHDYIRKEICDGRRVVVVSHNVLEFLEEKNYISFSRSNTKSYESALRSVQRLLKRIGYERGSKASKSEYLLSKSNVLKRDLYLLKMRRNRNMKKGSIRRIVSGLEWSK